MAFPTDFKVGDRVKVVCGSSQNGKFAHVDEVGDDYVIVTIEDYEYCSSECEGWYFFKDELEKVDDES